MPALLTIQPAADAAALAEAVRLFRAYAASLPIDLGYQGFEEELAGLPGRYAPPAGALLLAWRAEDCAVGCVAMRPLGEAGLCEMKRLYVMPDARGLRAGELLVKAVLQAAHAAGYREMRLDTLPTMAAALGLYARAGFREISAYYATPIKGTIFLGRAI